MSLRIDDVWQHYRNDLIEVEENIGKILTSQGGWIHEVGSYIFNSGGKRLRPLLAIIASKLAAERETDRPIKVLATAVELIHMASLLHDDVIDQADTRRGKQSARTIWRNKPTILIGDFLFAQGVSYVVDLKNHNINATFLEACRLMTKGEVLQLAHHRTIEGNEEQYLQIVQLKTASLISAICRLASMLSCSKPDQQEALAQFGLHAGMAYQIIDDALDYSADAGVFGKAVHQDLKRGEMTLPLLHLLSSCESHDREVVQNALHSGNPTEREVSDILALIRQYGSIEYCLKKAANYIEQGGRILASFPDSFHRDALMVLANYAISRKH